MKKSIYSKFCLLSITVVSPIALVISCNNIKVENDQIEKLSLSNKNLRQINDNLSYSSVSLENGYETTIFYPNSVVSVPGGIFVPTNKGFLLLDDKTLDIKWFTETSVGASNTRSIYSVVYIPETSKEGSSSGSILSARRYNDQNVYLELIDVETGEVFDNVTNVITPSIAINDSNPCNIQKVQGTTNKYVFVPLGSMTNEQRNQNTYLINLSNNGFDRSMGNGTGIEKVSLFETQSEESQNQITIVFSMGLISINDNIYSVSFQWQSYNQNKKSAIVVTEMNNTSAVLAYHEIESLDGETFAPNKMYIPTIKLSNNQNIIDFSTIANLSGTRCMIIDGSFDISSSTIVSNKIISLQPNWGEINNSKQDYDILWGYYSEKLNQWVTYCTWTYATQTVGSIVLFDLNNIKENSNFSIDSNNVQILSNKNEGPLYANRMDQWIPIISYDTTLNDFKNVYVFNMSNNNFKNQVIVYDTPLFLKNNPFTISNLNIDSKTNINDYISQINKEWLYQNKNLLFKNPDLLSNSNDITNFNVSKSDGQSLQVSFNVLNQNYSITITGFAKITLNIKPNNYLTASNIGISQTINEFYDDNKSNWVNWLTNNASKIFTNPEEITSTTKFTSVTATLNGSQIDFVFEFNGEPQQKFSITNFTNEPITIIKNNFNKSEFNIDTNSSNEFKDNIDENWIISYKQVLFKNPDLLNNSSQILNLSKKVEDQSGSILVSFSINSQNFSFKITGFQKNTNSSSRIAGAILSILGGILLLVAVFVFAKKKNNKNKFYKNN